MSALYPHNISQGYMSAQCPHNIRTKSFFGFQLRNHSFQIRMDENGMKRVDFTKEGSVVRIYLKNFMTYKDETIYPG